MTEQPEIDIAFAPLLKDRIDRYFAELGQGVNAHLLHEERRDILNWLNARSDTELAAMGLSRADIPGHVFADLFGRRPVPR